MATRPYQRSLTAAQRAAAIAKIHIGKKQLQLDDDTYRALLQQIGGVASSKDLTDTGIDDVLAHLRKAGAVFSNTAKAGKKPHTMRPVESRNDQLKKIEALLTDMELPWDYLIGRQSSPSGKKSLSMLERLTGKQRLEWCSGADLGKVIAALAIHQQKLKKAQEAV